MAFSVITPLACTLAGKKCLFIFLNPGSICHQRTTARDPN